MRAPEWMSNEMARLTLKLERYKPTGSGYNRIQSMRLSKSVTQMLNNPLPPAAASASAGSTTSTVITLRKNAQQQESTFTTPRRRGVLSRSESEWEEVYPAVKLGRQQHCNERAKSVDCSDYKFTHYRNCSTRIT
ncbi:GH11505 [Drosophila grimshawi]|uniref:GH11505 n=2 Tax=Drosophila grimshawi TaxID=7222 RepID=B4JB20_DROGR|nr:GH11505 [Drosophila grimshawi]